MLWELGRRVTNRRVAAAVSPVDHPGHFERSDGRQSRLYAELLIWRLFTFTGLSTKRHGTINPSP
jgi:hypothetical protein